MIVPLSSYHPDNQPLGRFRGIPLYLSTVLVIAHVAALFLSAFVGMGRWADSFMFAAPPSDLGGGAQIWRWVTYLFVNSPSIWFILDMVFLYVWGMRLEQTFGRKVFASLYVWLLFIPPAVTLILSFLGLPSLLAGPTFSHFCLFLAFCFMEPQAPFFVPHPAFQAKYVGAVFFAVHIVQYLGNRQYAWLAAFLANCLLTYLFLRRKGLPDRFEAITDAFRQALPKRRPSRPALPKSRTGNSPRRTGTEKPPATIYEPKIKPREDLYPEKKAVRDIDALLEKIGRDGLDSLTAEEREALQRASARLKREE
ncbi:MAG: rhomboid family intramembrane serine protease [Verrucomicrobiota bacterium]